MKAGKPKSRNGRTGQRVGASTASRKSPRTAANKTSRTTSRTASRTNQHTRKSASGKKSGRWIAGVTTVSTYPPQGLFTKDAATIAKTLATKKVSPKGPTSGLRMLLYFINRAGKGLSPHRRAELEKAKALLSDRIRNRKEPHKKG